MNTLHPGVQITAPLPMGAIQDLISIAKKGKTSSGHSPGNKANLLAVASAKKRNFVLVEKRDLKDYYEKDGDELSVDVLGFWSLLMSYVKIASDMNEGNRDAGPKQQLCIMPRTWWLKLYRLYGDDQSEESRRRKCKKKRRKRDKTLFQMVQELADKKGVGDIKDAKFLWKKDPQYPPGTTYPGVTGP